MKISDLRFSELKNKVRLANCLVNLLSDCVNNNYNSYADKYREWFKIPFVPNRDEAWETDLSVFSQGLDTHFLKIPNFGRKTLADLRSILPSPVPYDEKPPHCPFCHRVY